MKRGILIAIACVMALVLTLGCSTVEAQDDLSSPPSAEILNTATVPILRSDDCIPIPRAISRGEQVYAVYRSAKPLERPLYTTQVRGSGACQRKCKANNGECGECSVLNNNRWQTGQFEGGQCKPCSPG
ncbi:MAG TPA: hypothetical protein DCL61_15665 [Cyanobacteria bacterium UBA12227]|nr:hypothetical protein [Cyanobacteria bacterium UBA12227]HAX89032.1 hypothetical protein [Cyanobacteria bacterium UBA11370]HBY77623.1 hypothetical protein [Cyanobacteria bacterium UBA11148]